MDPVLTGLFTKAAIGAVETGADFIMQPQKYTAKPLIM
jgi:hypothetical protein